MKRVDLIKAIEGMGCELVRHGGKHDWYRTPIPEWLKRCRGTGRSRSGWLAASSGCSATRIAKVAMEEMSDPALGWKRSDAVFLVISKNGGVAGVKAGRCWRAPRMSHWGRRPPGDDPSHPASPFRPVEPALLAQIEEWTRA
jgi:hypothetical protein